MNRVKRFVALIEKGAEMNRSKKWMGALALAGAVTLAMGASALAKQSYDSSQESLASYGVPSWYSEGKLGIFMHLGPFSVPLHGGEWYARSMYYTEDNPTMQKKPATFAQYRDYHEKTYGTRDTFGYKDFILMLKLEKFDADYYADLVEKTGAAYFAAPAVHHDGFAMWDSKVIDWNSVKMGPKRDVVGELTAAMRRKGIKAGVSTHYGRHWRYYPFREEFDTWDPANEGLYGKRRGDTDPPRPEDARHWEDVLNELVDQYQPDYIFVDGGICDGHANYKTEIFRDALRRVLARYYNKSMEWDKGVVLTWKRDSLNLGEAVYDTEGKGLAGIPERPWQAHIAVGGWSYNPNTKLKPVDSILRNFVDLVSRNGNLLLNVGPMADGSLDKAQEKVLLQIGEWMRMNGEGITGSKPWKSFGFGKIDRYEGYDKDAIRYTQKDGALYAWFVSWPKAGKVTLPEAASFDPATIVPLGGSGKLKFTKEGDALVVDLPEKRFGKYLWGLKLTK